MIFIDNMINRPNGLGVGFKIFDCHFRNFFLGLFFLVSTSVSAQVSVYTFSQSLSGTGYVPLTGTPTVAYAAPWDDYVLGAAHQATLPFTFQYDGNPYTQCYISPNGFITFGATQPLPATYTSLSTNTLYSGVISPFGTNLQSNGFAIVYDVVGTAPNREFVIQWTDVQRVSNPTGNYNFQIRLKEANNAVELIYGLCSTTSVTLQTVQVGLRGSNATFAQGNVNNRVMSTDQNWFSNTNSGTLNSSTLRTTNLSYPDLALSYKYTPALPCIAPTAFPTALVLGGTSISHNAFVGNSFTAASPAPTNYLVLRSTVNTPPTAIQVPNRTFYALGAVIASTYTVVSVSALTTFTQTTLAPDTKYYYWVIPYNGACFGAPFYNLGNILTGSATTCSSPTVASAATNVGGNNFDANWTAVAGANDYAIDVSTTATFTALVPGFANFSMGNVTTFTVSGLAPLTTYYYRVRAIGIGCIVNSNTITTATICGYYSIPYSQNFDTTAIGVVPSCFTRADNNLDTIQWGVASITFASSPKSLFIAKNTFLATDDWFFLPGLNLIGGTTYRLFFRYKTGATTTTTENLKVSLGNAPAVVSMTQTLLDMPNINNTLFKSAFVDFTPVTSGVYSIGFEAYSVLNQSYIAVDDISVTVSPTCFEPIDLLAAPIGVTNATLSWTPPLAEPLSGYEYYISTSSTVPTSATVPSGASGYGINSVVINGLNASTTYYVWVRGNCGVGGKSIWSLEESFSTECNTPSVLSVTPATRCGVGSLTLSATPNIGSSINWYDSPSGGTLLASGNTFVTPDIAATTTYYVEAKALGAIAKTGPTSPTNLGGTIGVQNFSGAMNFTVINNTTLQSIDIYPYASGQTGQILLRNAANVTLATFPFVTTGVGGGILQNIPILQALTPGNYNLYLSVLPTSGLAMNTSGAFYFYNSAAASITGNSFDNSYYLGFYNWKFTTECISGRASVLATVTPPPALTLSATSTIICENETTPLVMVTGYGAYDTFVWNPNSNISGSMASGFTFNPPATTTYTLMAYQSSGSLCANRVTYTVTVNPLPPAVMVVPSIATFCENSIYPLTGSVGASSSVPILVQNFEGATNDWSVQQTSLLGDVQASKWTLRQSPYTCPGPFWTTTIVSNDNSQFYLTNSDSQGSGTLTRTTLQSPNFSLVGSTSAAVNFWHYIRYISGDTFFVQVTTDNGVNWTTIQNYMATQGTASSFVNSSVNLNAYIGMPNVSIRFNFISNWNYGWAIDNVTVSATLALALSWSPVTYLYTDSAATVPYVLGNAVSVVYVKPASSITYTATATGSNGCTTFNTSVITVDPLPIGGTLNGTQTLCNGASIANLTLTGYSGNIIRWEYADDATFTVNRTSIANTTVTLTAAQMGTIGSIRYFRAVIKNGVCSEVYSSVASVSFPTTTWNGTVWTNGLPNSATKVVFNGAYSSTGDIEACSVQVLSGNVVINSGHNLIVGNEVNFSSGSLTFENNASLVQTSNATNLGNITYKRTTTPMRRFDYTYWSSPVSPQTLVSLSPATSATKFFEWNTAVQNWLFTPGATVMQKAKGYIVRVPNTFDLVATSVYNGAFFGVPNNGTITIPIVVNGINNLNLLGNPYPSALSADLFLSDVANNTIVDATLYLWTHNTPYAAGQYTNNDYAVYNYSGGIGTGNSALNLGVNTSIPDGKIASGQGFFLRGLTNGVATFSNSMRLLGNNNAFFRMSQPAAPTIGPIERHRLWLDIFSAQGHYKQALIAYVETATNGLDRGFDGAVLDSGNPINFYSIIDDKKLSIQGRSLPFDANDTVPMGYKSTIATTYTIALSTFDGLFAGQNVYLRDKLLNIVHDLKAGNYTFTTEAGIFDNRFVAQYTAATLGVDLPAFSGDNVIIYKNSIDWQVASTISEIKSVYVYDIRGGLLLMQKNINALETHFDVGQTNQVLLVKITSVDNVTIIRKVIN